MNNDRLQVLFLPKWYPNELDPFDGNFIQNYAKAIQLKCDVKVVFVHSKKTIKQPFQINTSHTHNVEEVTVYFKKSTLPLVGKLINMLRYIKAQKIGLKQLKNQAIDVTHVHVLTRSSLLALSLKRKKGIPIVVSEHWTGYHPENGLYRGILKKIFTRHLIQQTSIIHVVSKQLQISMEKHGLKGNYCSIGNVVNTSLFRPKKTSHKKTRIIYVGNLIQRHKRILDLIQIVGDLTRQRTDFELLVYGEGNDEKKCRELIETNNWTKYIRLMGTLSQEGIAEAMANSHFLILYSDTENQPCVINEAQACGLPVVVPDIEGIVERMNEQLGIVFPKGKAEAFYEALALMLEKYNEYNKSYIREFAELAYSEENIANKFETLYLKAIEKQLTK